MSALAIICLVFGSVLFTLLVATVSFFSGAYIASGKRKQRQDELVFTRRYPESEVK